MNLQMVHCLDQLHNLDLERIASANRAPTEYFVPFFEILEANCHNVTPLLRVAHQPHTSKSHPLTGAVERDELFFTAWKDVKGNIEDFQSIVDRIEAYQDLLFSRSKGTTQHSEVMEMILESRIDCSQETDGRKIYLGYHLTICGQSVIVRSRKSLQQSDTIGRVSILVFIFFPLSLLTSIFGMNLISTDATWQVIIITASLLCLIILFVCVWM
jgi:hypothetical protein